MFADGAGGYGAATLCGSLGGACAISACSARRTRRVSCATSSTPGTRDHAFPSYQPEMESITTVSGAIECAVSVGNYMKATGYEMGDPGRKARCAAVTGETAAKAVELLNIHFGFEEAPAEELKAEAALAENEYVGTGVSEIGGEVKVVSRWTATRSRRSTLSHSETSGISGPKPGSSRSRRRSSRSRARMWTWLRRDQDLEALIAAVKRRAGAGEVKPD